MDQENNWLIRKLKTYPAPWHAKVHNPGSNHRIDVICDFAGEEIAHLAQLNPKRSGEQYRNNIRLIEHAPALLAALIEYAALEDSRGTLQPNLVELIHSAGGPDLRERLGQTAPKVSAAEKITPHQKDTVLRTTVKKRPRPLG